jgi:hypothetical protein
VLSLCFELLSSFLLKRHSETYARVSQQYSDALQTRHSPPGKPPSVLIVGNSLLLDGVDVDRLQKLTSGRMNIHPIFLEGTAFYDWYYGLRRLFREGARPQIVVLGVGVNSFLADTVRQDYVPMMLFDAQDTLGAASDLKFDHTVTSNLLFAHSSAFWDTRNVLRTQILRHLIFHYQDLVLLLKPQPTTPLPSLFDSVAKSRLEKLRNLCDSYDAKLIILLPPTPASGDSVHQFFLASQKASVETLAPIDPTSLPTKYFQADELHLNSEGAALFTSALAASLPTNRIHVPASSPE